MDVTPAKGAASLTPPGASRPLPGPDAGPGEEQGQGPSLPTGTFPPPQVAGSRQSGEVERDHEKSLVMKAPGKGQEPDYLLLEY